MNIDPVELGRGLGDIVHEAIAPRPRRVAELELLVKDTDTADIERVAKGILSGEDLDG